MELYLLCLYLGFLWISWLSVSLNTKEIKKLFKTYSWKWQFIYLWLSPKWNASWIGNEYFVSNQIKSNKLLIGKFCFYSYLRNNKILRKVKQPYFLACDRIPIYCHLLKTCGEMFCENWRHSHAHQVQHLSYTFTPWTWHFAKKNNENKAIKLSVSDFSSFVWISYIFCCFVTFNSFLFII